MTGLGFPAILTGMKAQPRKPPVPREKGETARQAIFEVLQGEPLTAKEVSGYVHLSEKEVCAHLEHIHVWVVPLYTLSLSALAWGRLG